MSRNGGTTWDGRVFRTVWGRITGYLGPSLKSSAACSFSLPITGCIDQRKPMSIGLLLGKVQEHFVSTDN